MLACPMMMMTMMMICKKRFVEEVDQTPFVNFMKNTDRKKMKKKEEFSS